MLPKVRLAFSPMTQRPHLTLPGGARFILWPVLDAAGIESIGELVLDDDPATLRTTSKPIVALSYNFEFDDIVLMFRESPARLCTRAIGLVVWSGSLLDWTTDRIVGPDPRTARSTFQKEHDSW
jgi:hypothetical protein